VAIALNDLGRHGRRLQAEPLADARLDRRIQVRERADRTRDLPHRDHPARAQHALEIPLQLGVPQRELQPERHRLCVHAVRPPDHRGHPMLFGGTNTPSARQLWR
jgi:hypothetical protein